MIDDDTLVEPKTPMAILVRRLAEIAMSVTHHDASDTEPGYVHEVQIMEQKFTAILRGRIKARTKPPARTERCQICGGVHLPNSWVCPGAY